MKALFIKALFSNEGIGASPNLMMKKCSFRKGFAQTGSNLHDEVFIYEGSVGDFMRFWTNEGFANEGFIPEMKALFVKALQIKALFVKDLF